jgi:multiple antibiotic resistance protein
MLEQLNVKEIITAFMVLFSVIDMPGSIPIIVSLNKKFGLINSKKATIVSGCIMVSFLFVGDKLLDFIGIDINSFAIAGAFVIFIIALEMILGIDIHKVEVSNQSSATIVPVAFPLIAGAGSLTTTLSLRAEFHTINILLGIVVNMVIVYAVLKSSDYLSQKMGDATLMVLKKVFGIILLAISIKLFITNFAPLISKYL